MLLSVVGNALPESWEDLRKDLFRIDAADIDLEDIQRRLKAFELNNKAKAGELSGHKGRAAPCAGDITGATGKQGRSRAESCEPKEDKDPAVPPLPAGASPAQPVFLRHSVGVPALQPRSNPANPRLDEGSRGKGEAPAVQLDLHPAGVQRGRTDISPCHTCNK